MAENMQLELEIMNDCLKRLTINAENVEKVITNAEKIYAESSDNEGENERIRDFCPRAIRLISESMIKVIGEDEYAEVIKKLDQIPEVSEEEAAEETEVLQLLKGIPKQTTADNVTVEDTRKENETTATDVADVADVAVKTSIATHQKNGGEDQVGGKLKALFHEFNIRSKEHKLKKHLKTIDPATIKRMVNEVEELSPGFISDYVMVDGVFKNGKTSKIHITKLDGVDGLYKFLKNIKL